MANNYNVSNVTTMEAAGESVAGGGIAPSTVLTITPHAGYVIQASDFSIGNTLPSEVTSVSFSDTTTALDVNNEVLATVNLATWFTMPASGNLAIGVDIDGATHTVVPRLSFFNTVATNVTNVTASFDLTSVISPAQKSISTSTTDGIALSTCYIDLAANQQVAVAALTITADSSYHLTSMPSFRLVSSDYEKWVILESPTYNSDGQIDSVLYNISYIMGDSDVPASLGEHIIWTVPTAEVDIAATLPKIVSLAYYDGYPHQSIIPVNANSNDLILNVHGNTDSSYTVKIVDSNGLSYDFSTNTFTRPATVSETQYVYSPSTQLAMGRHPNKNTHTITIPTYSKEIRFSRTFTTTITPTGETYTARSGMETDKAEPLSIILYQLGQVDFTLQAATATHGETISTLIIKSITNGFPMQKLSTFNPATTPGSITGYNGYFTTSQALGYTITNTTDGAVSTSGSPATIQMATAHATLKLQVGDTVTGTNIAANSTIASLGTGGGDALKQFTLNQDVGGTVADETTLTFTRTVGISRQPTTTDIITSSPITLAGGLSSSQSYLCKNDVSNSATIHLKSDDNSQVVSGLVAGMLVSGDEIVGFPTILFVSGDTIAISSSQTITAGQVLKFTVAGTSTHITELNVTGAGTANCKLNVSGYVERLGIDDVVANLTLENFVTTYATPTIVATTANCPVGGSVVIEPLSGCTGHTGTLTIATVPSKGAGGAVITEDGQSILYSSSVGAGVEIGTTDTITYTINDGVSANTSPANIVVTLT